jgi:uncharacterized protein
MCHPSKFHVFRNTINALKEKGHKIDIIIISKDVLEDLIITEGWDFNNIFPEGRKIKNLPMYVGAGINTIKSLIRFEKYLWRKKYDLIVTDDLIVINAKIRKIPTIYFQDDDITAVPQTIPLLMFAKHILSPFCSNMGSYQTKKISFHGFKELAYLHPNKFIPNYEVVKQFNPNRTKYFIIRLVNLKAIHDGGKKGLNNDDVFRIIEILKPYGHTYISSERELPSELNRYRINIKVTEIAHSLYFSTILISDSQTMSAEAGILGTPFIRCNDFIGKISNLNELENKYKLGFGVPINNKESIFSLVENLAKKRYLKEEWISKRDNMLSDQIDLTNFMIWLFENYPESIKILEKNSKYQLNFK